MQLTSLNVVAIIAGTAMSGAIPAYAIGSAMEMGKCDLEARDGKQVY